MQLLEEEKVLKDNLIEQYYLSANETQKFWKRDNSAALKIQSIFRMFIKRKQFLRKKAAAIKVQTLFRAFFARKMFKKRKAQDSNEKNFQYFARQAMVIQKMFRGFYVRKYVHNFYLRKEQLKALERKNDEFRRQLNQIGRAEYEENEDYKKQLAKAQFSALAKNLHHLTSTKNIPGVYNSPFAMQKPSVFDKTVQDHLAENFHETYKWRPPRKQDILKHSLQPIKGTK